jgi:2-dehydropantoate 2-reductase
MVLPLQNGVEAPGILVKVLGKKHVLGGLCGIFSFRAGPGHIRHTGVDPYIKFAELDNKISDRVVRLRDALKVNVASVEIPADIQVAMWKKLLSIVPFSALGAITRSPIGIWRSQEATFRIAEQCLEEIYKVAKAHNVNLPDDCVAEELIVYNNLPSESKTSMQRDLMEGRPSELDAQLGAVVRLGREKKVPTPVHDIIYYSLLPMELKARGEITF